MLGVGVLSECVEDVCVFVEGVYVCVCVCWVCNLLALYMYTCNCTQCISHHVTHIMSCTPTQHHVTQIMPLTPHAPSQQNTTTKTTPPTPAGRSRRNPPKPPCCIRILLFLWHTRILPAQLCSLQAATGGRCIGPCAQLHHHCLHPWCDAECILPWLYP